MHPFPLSFPVSVCRLPVSAGESGMEGAVVLCVGRRPPLPPGPEGPADLASLPAPPRLWGGSRAGAQAPLRHAHTAGQHRGGCSGGKSGVFTDLVFLCYLFPWLYYCSLVTVSFHFLFRIQKLWFMTCWCISCFLSKHCRNPVSHNKSTFQKFWKMG